MKNSNNNTQPLNIVTALSCEARALIDHFKLQKQHHESAFDIFSNDKGTHLIVSGIGPVKAASATAYLHGITGNNPNSLYLNLGIAGSSQAKLGEAYLIEKLCDQSTDKNYYPFVAPFSKLPLAQCTTLPKPLSTYPKEGLVDMEAAAFFIAANQFVTQEQIQIIKVISDNDEKSLSELSAAKVSAMMNAKLDTVLDFINEFRKISTLPNNTTQTDWFDTFNQQWHFTQYQQHELRELLRRWHVHRADESPLNACEGLANSKAVLSKLQETLEQHPYAW